MATPGRYYDGCDRDEAGNAAERWSSCFKLSPFLTHDDHGQRQFRLEKDFSTGERSNVLNPLASLLCDPVMSVCTVILGNAAPICRRLASHPRPPWIPCPSLLPSEGASEAPSGGLMTNAISRWEFPRVCVLFAFPPSPCRVFFAERIRALSNTKNTFVIADAVVSCISSSVPRSFRM